MQSRSSGGQAVKEGVTALMCGQWGRGSDDLGCGNRIAVDAAQVVRVVTHGVAGLGRPEEVNLDGVGRGMVTRRTVERRDTSRLAEGGT